MVRTLPRVIPGNEFMRMDIPQPVPLVVGVIDQGGKLAIGGGSKSHKSWIFADLALCLSAGIDWLGLKTAKHNVLYMNFEIPPYHFQQRLKAISARRSIDVPPELCVWNLRGYAMEHKDAMPEITKAIKANSSTLGITDPLYKIEGNIDENSTAAVTALLNAIETITVETGAAMAYAGHFSKGNQAAKNPIDRISGTGVHGRDPDAIINFTAHKEQGAYTVDFTLRCYPPIPPFVVRWQCPLMVIDRALDPNDLQKKQPGRPKKLTVIDLVNILRVERKIDEDVFFALAEKQHKVSRRTFERLLTDLRLYPNVLRLPDGQWIYTA